MELRLAHLHLDGLNLTLGAASELKMANTRMSMSGLSERLLVFVEVATAVGMRLRDIGSGVYVWT